MSYQKNEAGQKFMVLAVNTTNGQPFTGDAANITAQISKDFGSFASLTDTNPTELDSTNAAGVYVFDLAQAETNGDVLTIMPSSSTANVQIDMLNIYTTSVTGYTPEQIADQVWDESASGHNVGGSFGKFVRQMKEGLIVEEASVDDSSATTTSFITTLPKSVDDFYNDDTLVFISGDLIGQSRIIDDYDGGDLRVTFDEPLTAAPADTDEFILLAGHNHSATQISSIVWDAQTSNHAIPGSTGAAVASAASEVSVLLPASGTVPERSLGETIRIFNQEQIVIAVAVFDLNKNPVDLTGRSLWFGAWDRGRDKIIETTPTGTATGFTVTIPKTNGSGSNNTWVVRDGSGTGEVILTGPLEILKRPTEG